MKKIPLRIYFVLAMGILVLIIAAFFISRIIVNHAFVSDYNREIYDTENEEMLLSFNFPESFVPYYNLGNAAYKKGDYNSAVDYFTRALSMYPTEEKECLIRINLALSLCNTINFNALTSQEKIDTALFVLYKARDVLLENGCAMDDPDVGHNADAQQLKEDIDAMIERLRNPNQDNNSSQQPDSSDKSDSSNDEGNNNNVPSDREKRIQNELEENKKDALEDRKDQQDNLEKWSDYINGEGQGLDENGDSGGSSGYNKPW